MPPFRPEEIFHRTGYYQNTRKSFLSRETYHTLSLPHPLLIAADAVFLAALMTLRHHSRQRRRRQAFRKIEAIAATSSAP